MAISNSVKVGYIDLTGNQSEQDTGTAFALEDKQTYIARIARISVGDSPTATIIAPQATS